MLNNLEILMGEGRYNHVEPAYVTVRFGEVYSKTQDYPNAIIATEALSGEQVVCYHKTPEKYEIIHTNTGDFKAACERAWRLVWKEMNKEGA